jgi:hypothetical protein
MITVTQNITTLESFTEGITERVCEFVCRILGNMTQLLITLEKYLGKGIGCCQPIHFPIVPNIA